MTLQLAHPKRINGFVTQAMINKHGSYPAALAHLNATTPKQERRT